ILTTLSVPRLAAATDIGSDRARAAARCHQWHRIRRHGLWLSRPARLDRAVRFVGIEAARASYTADVRRTVRLVRAKDQFRGAVVIDVSDDWQRDDLARADDVNT